MNEKLRQIYLQRWNDPEWNNSDIDCAVKRINQLADTLYKDDHFDVWDGTDDHATRKQIVGIIQYAFRAWIFNDTNAKQLVKETLLKQTEITARIKDVYSNEEGFHEAGFFQRLFNSYLYIKDIFTEQEMSKFETWMINQATDFANNINSTLESLFPNRLNEDYSVTSGPAKSGGFNEGELTHMDGGQIYWCHKYYNNRKSSIVGFFGSIGIILNVEELKKQAILYFKETLKFGTWPDGSLSDYERAGDYGRPQQGVSYSCIIVAMLVKLADLLHQKGDDSLYKFSTSYGIFSTVGGNKNLELVVDTQFKIAREEINRYYKVREENYRLKFVSPLGDSGPSYFTHDSWAFPAINYFKKWTDQWEDIKKREKRYSDFRRSGSGNIWYPWGGSCNIEPHIPFQTIGIDVQEIPEPETEPPADVEEYSSVRKGYWKIKVNGILLDMNFTEERTATGRATYLKYLNPNDIVEVIPPEYEIRVKTIVYLDKFKRLKS